MSDTITIPTRLLPIVGAVVKSLGSELLKSVDDFRASKVQVLEMCTYFGCKFAEWADACTPISAPEVALAVLNENFGASLVSAESIHDLFAMVLSPSEYMEFSADDSLWLYIATADLALPLKYRDGAGMPLHVRFPALAPKPECLSFELRTVHYPSPTEAVVADYGDDLFGEERGKQLGLRLGLYRADEMGLSHHMCDFDSYQDASEVCSFINPKVHFPEAKDLRVHGEPILLKEADTEAPKHKKAKKK